MDKSFNVHCRHLQISCVHGKKASLSFQALVLACDCHMMLPLPRALEKCEIIQAALQRVIPDDRERTHFQHIVQAGHLLD